MTTRLLRTVTATSFLALVAAQALSPAVAEESKVLATVGERSITQADLDQALKDMGQQFANFPEAQRKARALDSLIDIHVLAAKAEQEGLLDDAETKRRLDLLRNRALHNGYFEAKVQPTVDEAAMKARYDKEIGNATPEQEVSARHILVKTEDEAKAIIVELDGGADFVELAKTKSTGPSGPQGGELGYFGKGKMVPEFEQAAFALEKGAYTKEPVKSQFGYHVIRVDDKRDVPLPSFEASKQQLRQVMLSEAYSAALKGAREEIGAVVVDETLKLPQN